MTDFLQWWNAIYWVPLAVSLLWILLTAIAGHGDHDGAGHGHADHALHAHVPHGHFHNHGHVDTHAHGHDHGRGLDHGHGHGHGHDAAHHNGWASRLTDLLGIGRVPITLFIGMLMLFWGTFGLIANMLLKDNGLPPLLYITPSLGATAFFTMVATRMSAGVIGRYMPTTETFAITVRDLIGREGAVVYTVTEKAGTVQVADSYGTLHRCMARGESGATAIPANRRILVVGIDDQGDANTMNDRLIVRECGVEGPS